MTATAAEIRTNVTCVRERVRAACLAAGRDDSDVTLIAVTKTQPVHCIAEAIGAGITDIGENYLQEGAPKVRALRAEPATASVRTHFIGHLQRNKVAEMQRSFDVLHSLDSERLVGAIERSPSAAPLPAFIQVNIDREPSKGGVSPGELTPLIERARASHALHLLGLMAIPSPGDTRQAFRALAALARSHRLPYLSIGMTDDFELAIAAGATHIRVGRAIFGERT
jgi:hypothetical protein